MTRAEHARKIYALLRKTYPHARCTVDNINPLQFLFASILSPQCTDVVTNAVSQDLWRCFKTVAAIAAAPPSKIERVIKRCGMYHIKARYLKASARLLAREYDGAVPDTLVELLRFSGVGRKVALVILLEVFGITEGIIIDTHNIRVAQRLGLTDKQSADTIERDLMACVPKQYWRRWSHLMVAHGRAVCTARKPKCSACPLLALCSFGKKVHSA